MRYPLSTADRKTPGQKAVVKIFKSDIAREQGQPSSLHLSHGVFRELRFRAAEQDCDEIHGCRDIGRISEDPGHL